MEKREWKTIKEYQDILFDFYNGIAKITITDRCRRQGILFRRRHECERSRRIYRNRRCATP